MSAVYLVYSSLQHGKVYSQVYSHSPMYTSPNACPNASNGAVRCVSLQLVLLEKGSDTGGLNDGLGNNSDGLGSGHAPWRDTDGIQRSRQFPVL